MNAIHTTIFIIAHDRMHVAAGWTLGDGTGGRPGPTCGPIGVGRRSEEAWEEEGPAAHAAGRPERGTEAFPLMIMQCCNAKAQDNYRKETTKAMILLTLVKLLCPVLCQQPSNLPIVSGFNFLQKQTLSEKFLKKAK